MTDTECTCDSLDYGTALDCPFHGVHARPQRFPEPHYPPRKVEGGPDVVLMPFPHTLVCPGCGLSRSLPTGWQQMLGTETLSCTECLQVMREDELPSEGGTQA